MFWVCRGLGFWVLRVLIGFVRGFTGHWGALEPNAPKFAVPGNVPRPSRFRGKLGYMTIANRNPKESGFYIVRPRFRLYGLGMQRFRV